MEYELNCVCVSDPALTFKLQLEKSDTEIKGQPGVISHDLIPALRETEEDDLGWPGRPQEQEQPEKKSKANWHH